MKVITKEKEEEEEKKEEDWKGEWEGICVIVERGDNPQEVVDFALHKGAYSQGGAVVNLLFPGSEMPVLIRKKDVDRELFEWNEV